MKRQRKKNIVTRQKDRMYPASLPVRNKAGKHKRRHFRTVIINELRANSHISPFPFVKFEYVADLPTEVTCVRYHGLEKSGYAVCPTCGYAMEREYQNHCEVCGQTLAWNMFLHNAVDVERIKPPLDYDPSINDPLKGLIHNISQEVAPLHNRQDRKIDYFRLKFPHFVEVRKKANNNRD